MQELLQIIPDASLLLSLTPEELGAKMLFILRRRSNQSNSPLAGHGNGGMYILNSLQNELWPSYNINNQYEYPRDKRNDINLVLSEAWAWLVAQGLMVPADGMNGQNGWHVLSRRARAIENETDFASFKIARLLSKEILHPKIATPVWGAFMRGEFDVAAFQAMKGVEVAVVDARKR